MSGDSDSNAHECTTMRIADSTDNKSAWVQHPPKVANTSVVHTAPCCACLYMPVFITLSLTGLGHAQVTLTGAILDLILVLKVCGNKYEMRCFCLSNHELLMLACIYKLSLTGTLEGAKKCVTEFEA